MIVEDEEDVARYLSAALEDEGYRVLVAENAERGLAIVRSILPDLICLDLVMPGRTGLSLYRELCEEDRLVGVPIVVVSGVSAGDAEEKLGIGDTSPPPAAFVEKPVDMPEFLATIKRLIEARTGSR